MLKLMHASFEDDLGSSSSISLIPDHGLCACFETIFCVYECRCVNDAGKYYATEFDEVKHL